ncbi:hypothetical protein HPB50_023402 [Hyalomma asiaticum]|uniref:Uncharacterized protein n=1 Tax=Hyalomma asiaticum TaxID=266040 RepID=A0ACB7S5T7_HYAAI|nr:hypothetical protein HPB50_023402 [Hyalomma asiaticum]
MLHPNTQTSAARKRARTHTHPRAPVGIQIYERLLRPRNGLMTARRCGKAAATAARDGPPEIREKRRWCALAHISAAACGGTADTTYIEADSRGPPDSVIVPLSSPAAPLCPRRTPKRDSLPPINEMREPIDTSRIPVQGNAFSKLLWSQYEEYQASLQRVVLPVLRDKEARDAQFVTLCKMSRGAVKYTLHDFLHQPARRLPNLSGRSGGSGGRPNYDAARRRNSARPLHGSGRPERPGRVSAIEPGNRSCPDSHPSETASTLRELRGECWPWWWLARLVAWAAASSKRGCIRPADHVDPGT